MSGGRHPILALGAALAGLALAACDGDPAGAGSAAGTPAPAPGVTVLGSAAKVRPRDAATGTAGASLVAARNEFESFQVVVHAGAVPLRNVTVSLAEPPAGPDGKAIPAANVTVHRVGYLEVTTPSDPEGAPGPWPDPLIPAVDTLVGEARDAFPVDVPAGENRVAWVEVLVPLDTAPGVYRGALAVTADGWSARVPLAITVLAFTLPSTATLKTSFGLSEDTCAPLGLEDCADPAVRAGVRQLFLRSALDHRVTLGHPHAPWSLVGEQAGAEEFRRFFLPYVEGTGDTRLPGARLTTYQVNRVSDRGLSGWRAEAERGGFLDRAFVWSCDEPYFFPVYGDPAGNWPLCHAVLEADRAAWPDGRRLVTAHLQTATDAGALELIDLLVVNLEFLHGPPRSPWYEGDQRPLYDPFLAAPGKELWLYSACGSHGCTRNDDPYTAGWAGGYEVDAPASEVRALPWLAFRYDATGLLYYDTVLQLATAWDDAYRYTGNGEGTLFYPGTPARIGGTRAIPLASIRLAALRDGLEDHEYLVFLRDNGLAAEARRIAAALFPAPYDTARTDAEVQAARRELAALVAGVTGGPAPP